MKDKKDDTIRKRRGKEDTGKTQLKEETEEEDQEIERDEMNNNKKNEK